MSINPLGYYSGRHYTEYGEVVELLLKQAKFEDAERLLLALIEVIEQESRLMDWGVAPWYYGKLAILYRKQKRRNDEIAILERFAAQKHASGAMPPKLLDRLRKLKNDGDEIV